MYLELPPAGAGMARGGPGGLDKGPEPL
jgi:hypothetical protein